MSLAYCAPSRELLPLPPLGPDHPRACATVIERIRVSPSTGKALMIAKSFISNNIMCLRWNNLNHLLSDFRYLPIWQGCTFDVRDLRELSKV